MPSTLVHLGIAGLVAAALLGEAFRARTLAVVLLAVVVVDLDVFVGFVVIGAHRSAFHTLLWPTLLGAALVYDARIRDRSWLRGRFGPDAPRTAAVTIVAVVFAAIGPDAVTNGANLFYPVHDQFYALDGRLRFSTERGILQSFVEEPSRGSSEETQYYTGADPDPANEGAEPDTERIFLIVDSGLQALLVVLGTVTVTARLWTVRLRGSSGDQRSGDEPTDGNGSESRTGGETGGSSPPATDSGGPHPPSAGRDRTPGDPTGGSSDPPSPDDSRGGAAGAGSDDQPRGSADAASDDRAGRSDTQ